ncbi:MAG: sporulation protein, partial [Pseudomonadota bacterium]|nr:sporulation protein [Pseudomonadota bacterium]
MGGTGQGLNGLEAGGLFPRLQERYGLRENPVEMETPFFPDAMRHHALETLRHLCGFGDLGLVLVGAVGSGKTRILAELVRAESSRLEFYTLRAADLTSSEALARHLLSAAHRSIDGTDNARDAVYGFFRWSETRVRKGRRVVLL